MKKKSSQIFPQKISNPQKHAHRHSMADVEDDCSVINTDRILGLIPFSQATSYSRNT